MSEALKREKPGGGAFDVTRNIPLAPIAAEKLQDAVRQLAALEPVLDAYVDRHGRLHVAYDTAYLDLGGIERLLDKAGVARAPGAWWRLKSAWYRFLDGNARANAHSQGGACCNRPPAASGGNRDAGKPG
ncbi:MAG: hypothetical protein ACM3KD_04670 [Hyphomicrobiaceae bacterium]